MEVYLGLISIEVYHLVRRNFSEQLLGFSNSYRVSHSATKFNVCVCMLSYAGLFETPWIVAGQAPLSREFSGKNTRLDCHLHSGNLHDQEMEPGSPVAPVLTSRIFTNAPTGKLH